MPEEKQDPDYDLKKSQKVVGQLYPILKAADGEIIDGVHRAQADPSWQTLTLPQIDSEEKKLAARLIANFHRRHVPIEEKAAWINDLAKLYREQGLKVEGARKGRQGSNEIVDGITGLTGLSKRTVLYYLQPEFKNGNYQRLEPDQHETRSSARDIVFNALGGRSPAWAEKVIVRFTEEIKLELKKDIVFRSEVAKELSRSYACSLVHKRKPVDSREPEVIEPGDYYRAFLEVCPNCECGECPHALSCESRVRPED